MNTYCCSFSLEIMFSGHWRAFNILFLKQVECCIVHYRDSSKDHVLTLGSDCKADTAAHSIQHNTTVPHRSLEDTRADAHPIPPLQTLNLVNHTP